MPFKPELSLKDQIQKHHKLQQNMVSFSVYKIN